MSSFPLKSGSSGNLVKQAQRWLNLALEIQGSTKRLQEDGKYGPATAEVVKTLFNRTQITEGDYKLMTSNVDNMVARLREIKSSGKNPDNLVKSLIQSEQAIFENLLKIAAIYEGSSQGQRSSYAQAFEKAAILGQRLSKRTAALKAQSAAIKLQTGAPAYLDPLVNRYVKGIGIVFLIPFILPATAAIIVSKSATAVYDWLTPHYRESTTDFKVTKELRAVLDKLSPEDQKIVLQTAETQIDQAYNEGHRDGDLGGGLFGNVGKIVKYVVIGGGVGLATWALWPIITGGRAAAQKRFN